MELLGLGVIIGLLVLTISADGGNTEAEQALRGGISGAFVLLALGALCAVLAALAGVDVFAMAGG